MCPNASAVMKEIICSSGMEETCYKVVTGGLPVTKKMSSLKWDLVFFTGGTVTGRHIAKACADNLVPYILELGGKNPVLVDEDCDLTGTAKRIAYGRYQNTGQVCLCPDQILIHDKIYAKFKDELVKQIRSFWPVDDPNQMKECGSYGRLVNQDQTKRISDWLREKHGGNFLIGNVNEIDIPNRQIPPMVVEEPKPGSSLEAEEVFGPVLTIFKVPSMEKAIEITTEREKPLVYTQYGTKNFDMINNNTTSGQMVRNDSILWFMNNDISFGGVGSSGIGRYHSYEGFKALSNPKSVVSSAILEPQPVSLKYPIHDVNKYRSNLSTLLKIFKVIIW